jgi:hypothetical protein
VLFRSANALAGQDLDPPSDCSVASNCDDISIAYANAYIDYFYYGTDGNTQGKTDFESVVMHEIGHGLGFSGSLYATWNGSYYTGNRYYTYPFMYDTFAIDNNGTALLNESVYPRGGTALGSILTSGVSTGKVFLNGANARAANGNTPVPLYVPSTWSGGSSYAHLAESYNGTVNAMMTYSIGANEVLHDPGPVTMGVLKDDGWSTSTATPATPTNLSAVAASSSQINLSWTDNSTNETSFSIQWAGGDLVWGYLGEGAAVPGTGGIGSFASTGLTEGTQYNYRVCASNGSSCSAFSNVATTKTIAAAPTNLTATAVSSSQINLTWTDHSAYETTFSIQRAGSDMVWGYLGEGAVVPGSGGTGSFSNTGLSEGTQYNYRLCASNGSACSAFTNVATATTIPNAPTNLTAVAVSTTQINLAWTDNSAKETSYSMQRAGSDMIWGYLGEASAVPGTGGTGSFNNTGLVEGTQYHYRLCAANGVACSTFSNAADSGTMLTAPTLLGATPVNWHRIDVTWTDNTTKETGYEIQISHNGVDGWMTIATYTAGAGATTGVRTYQDGSAVMSKVYYRVRAVTAFSTSAWLSGANATPIIAPYHIFTPKVTK